MFARIARFTARAIAGGVTDAATLASRAVTTGRQVVSTTATRIAAAVEPTAARQPLLAEDVTGEVPAVEEIHNAARAREDARLETNAAARTKRAADKVLGRTPDGRYGDLVVERFESSRFTADLDAIRETYKALGLGEVPMKRGSASLVLTWAQEETEQAGAQLVAIAA